MEGSLTTDTILNEVLKFDICKIQSNVNSNNFSLSMKV